MGFTKGGRIEFNHFLLQYVVERANRTGTKLIVLALDFKKAFDSIDRSKMIEVLIKYKVHPCLIDLIVKIYSDDITTLILGDMKIDMKISSGIKQGCTVSTTLFKLITYMIMSVLEKSGVQYWIDNLSLSSIFFADDSIAIAKTEEEAKKNLKIITDTSSEYGLHINKEKSNALVYNNSEGIQHIDGVKVVSKIKYLGLLISDGIDMFKDQKEEMIAKAKRMSNLTYAVIAKSSNKMLMGKTFWKSVVLTSVLYGAGLMNTTDNELSSLQVVENGVFRKILGGRKFTAISALRGEVGSSLMKTRFIKSRLMLVKSIQESSNELMKEILNNIRKDRFSPWNSTLNIYLRWIDISYNDLINMTRDQVDKKVKEYDSNLWRKDMATKSSLVLYREYKKDICEEKMYDNRNASVLLFLAKTKGLKLNIEKRHTGGETTCSLCREEAETTFHFLFKCSKLKRKRNKRLIDACVGNTEDQRLGKLLFVKDVEEVKSMLHDLWQLRYKLTKELNNS